MLSTYVERLSAKNLSKVDESDTSLSSFTRDPLDAPVLLDETRGLMFVKNKIFDASNLAKLIYTLPSGFDTFDGATENAYALDATHGHMATKNYVYELSRYGVVTATTVPSADQLFFDKDGVLWFLSISGGALKAQVIHP